MSGIKISQLPLLLNAQLTDVFPVDQSGITSQESLLQVRTLFGFNSSSGLLSLAKGGTNASLTATLNSLVYSTSSALALLATSNNGTLITSNTGVPSISSTLPSAVQNNITHLGTQSAALDMNTHLINNVVDPVSAQDAATKNYVDAIAAGFSIKGACRLATTTSLTVVYANGAAGVGATLTNNGTQVALNIDGVAAIVNDRILVKNQASAFQNGIYTVTDIGSGSTNWIMTRATDYDQAAEIKPGDLILINAGATQANSSWVQTSTVATMGTDAINFSKFSSANSINKVGVQTFTSGSSTYTPSLGMVYCVVEIVGGGGSGGGVSGGTAGQIAAATGGAGGGYCRKLYTATQIGANAAVVVGAGGTGASAGAHNGNAGSNSTFTPAGPGVVLTAGGGGAGSSMAKSVSAQTAAGASGGTATNGDLNIPGMDTIYSITQSTGSLGLCTSGGNSMFGFGGSAAPITSDGGGNGRAGTGYGSGSSGAVDSNSSDRSSAAGQPGICYITEFCAT